MKVLITGGAGFIGSHLAEFLLARGDTVVAIDDLSTGRTENIVPLEPHPRFQCHRSSIMNEELLSELMDTCDLVFHLAAAVGVQLVAENPMRTMMTNIAGTETVLRLAARKRQRVLLTSTSEVYGKRTEVPFREDDDLLLGAPGKRRWSYACSKAADEFLGQAYWQEQGVPVVIARLFNTVGPRQTGRYGMVIPRFVAQALAGEPLTVYGDGHQRRCFADVRDVVRILARLAELPEAAGEIVNVGNDEEVSILDLARQVKAQVHSASEIVFVPYRVAYGREIEDMERRVPDLSKLERLLGERPRTRLADILAAVIEHTRAEQEGAAGDRAAGRVRKRAGAS